MFVADTGLLAHVMGLGPDESREPGPRPGTLLEAFVAQELRKQTSWSESKPELYFHRSHAGPEVDFVLKGPGGRLVGVEVKSAGSVRSDDLRGLEDFAEAAGRKFHRGVFLYGEDTSVAFGDRLHAVPIAALWGW